MRGLRSAPFADHRDRREKERAARLSTGRSLEGLGRANVLGARTLGALGDLELDLLTANEAVEIERGVEPAAMEEVFLRILGGDEAEAAIGNDLLDGTGGHHDLQHFPNKVGKTRPVRKGLTTRSIDASCDEAPP